jgi:hypothetical protein
LSSAQRLLSSNPVLYEELQHLLQEVTVLNKELSKWSINQPEVWKPKTISFMNRKQGALAQGLGWLSNRIDSYLDRK